VNGRVLLDVHSSLFLLVIGFTSGRSCTVSYYSWANENGGRRVEG
jgi:hypothetical protein